MPVAALMAPDRLPGDLSMPSRRSVLKVLAGAAGGLALASTAGCDPAPPPDSAYTVERWRSERGTRYLVGHRGVGDVVPEHTQEAYDAALKWGAKALEVSVVQTKDGVLLCQHDLTFERTTTLTGKVSDTPLTTVMDGRVDIPRLGPRWQGSGAPRIALLKDVLTKIGAKAVLCLEAKDDAAFPAMLAMVDQLGLKGSVIVKLHVSSGRFAEARAAGYPLFGYVGSFAEATADGIATLGKKLQPASDVLVVPSNENGDWLPDASLAAAVATGIPVWVFGVHRRSELAYHVAHGAVGAVASSIGYLSGGLAPRTASAWDTGALTSGEMTRQPDDEDDGLGWPELGVVSLRKKGGQAFLTVGQLAPLSSAAGYYQVDVGVRVDTLPTDGRSNVTVAFGHTDDRYYEHRQGLLDGYHALLRMDGSLEVWAHTAGSAAGQQLAPAVTGPPPESGTWIPLRLAMTPSAITWSRLDTGAAVTAADARFRGDYIHLGRSAPDGQVSLRQLRVS